MNHCLHIHKKILNHIEFDKKSNYLKSEQIDRKYNIFIILLIIFTTLSADSAIVSFDFNEDIVSGESPYAYIVDEQSGFKVRLSSDLALGTKNSNAIDWTETEVIFDTSLLDNFIGEGFSFGNSWETFITSGSKTAVLTLTLSNLVAGAAYQIAFITGCPYEGKGKGDGPLISTFNAYDSVYPKFNTNVSVEEPTGFSISNIIANNTGEITFTATPGNSGQHTPTFNSIAISGPANIPEASIGYLGGFALLALLTHRRKI